MIAYGAEIERKPAPDVVAKYGVEPEKYFLYVSRLEPENNAAMVIEAFRNINTDLKLVIVGDAPYATAYKKRLKELAANDERIIFTGFVFGSDYKTLQQNAYAYIHATEVGGTHPALIEAMGFGNCVLCLSTTRMTRLRATRQFVLRAPMSLRLSCRRSATMLRLSKIIDERPASGPRTNYSWDAVTEAYEKLFASLANERSR